MGTRTAVFQEQENGKYLGIYVHYDGYIEGVGKTLFEHYNDKDKTAELINKKYSLISLGKTTEILSFDEYSKIMNKNNGDEVNYCASDRQSEYFIADSLKDVQDLQYLCYGNGEVDGYYINTEDGKEFKPFRGSDNNGFLYVQDLKGVWHVSLAKETSPYDMKNFEKLEKYIVH